MVPDVLQMYHVSWLCWHSAPSVVAAVVENRDADLEGAVQQIDTIISAEKRRVSRLRLQDAKGATTVQQPLCSAARAGVQTPELQKC